MPIRKFHFQTSVALRESRSRSSSDSYDAQGMGDGLPLIWYDDARVPHLLIHLQDDLTVRSRREAAWISIMSTLLLTSFLAKMISFENTLPMATARSDENLYSRQGSDVSRAFPRLAEGGHTAEHEHCVRQGRIADDAASSTGHKELRKS